MAHALGKATTTITIDGFEFEVEDISVNMNPDPPIHEAYDWQKSEGGLFVPIDLTVSGTVSNMSGTTEKTTEEMRREQEEVLRILREQGTASDWTVPPINNRAEYVHFHEEDPDQEPTEEAEFEVIDPPQLTEGDR